MNLNNYYWYFVKALSSKTCDKIIKHGNKVKDSLAVVGDLSRKRNLEEHPLNKKEIADLKRKIDICFKVKRPKYVQAVNRMIDNAIINDKSLVEDSVKHYQGFTESK